MILLMRSSLFEGRQLKLANGLGYTDNEPHEHISDVLFRQSRGCLSAKPVRERDPPRGDFFKRKKLAAWVRGPLGLGLDARGCVLLVHFDVLPNYLLCLRRRPQIPLFAPRSAG
jgi:hypothetical protein